MILACDDIVKLLPSHSIGLVKAAAQGFDTQIKTNIELQVQQVAKVDVALVVGQATQTIEVSASAEALATIIGSVPLEKSGGSI